jgi:prepilin-type N-terminal cleavage/methylation domain-containing protein
MKKEKGFTFIEVVIGLAVMGIIAVGFLGGLTTASKGLMIADERETANNLAEAQVEYVKNQAYDSINNPPQYQKLPSGKIPDGYDIKLPMAARLDPDGDGLSDDDGMQEITVTVKHGSKEVLTLKDYKVN